MLALAWATEPDLINSTLEYALTDAIRAQDTPMLMGAVAERGGASLQAAWSFLRRLSLQNFLNFQEGLAPIILLTGFAHISLK